VIYNNLISFLVIILVFSTASVPAEPWLSPGLLVLALLLLFSAFYLVAARTFGRRIHTAAAYFQAERKLTILAVLLFCFCVYGLDIKYYFNTIFPHDTFPALVDTLGLCFYFLLLAILWSRAHRSYGEIFQPPPGTGRFILINIRTNLPIVLPWLALSYVFDLLTLLPVKGLDKLLDSPWGDLLLFGLFLLFLIVIFPPLVLRLWDCRPLPAGEIRNRIEAFCRRQNFSVGIYLWPLFGGRMLTAAIMGFLPGFRYLLITPGLLSALSPEEIEAVVAHEIGHIKGRHLPLYLLLFLGFSLLSGFVAEPIYFLILDSGLPYRLIKLLRVNPETIAAILNGLPMLLMMLIYFRFIFGYFIRNFERQADLHVFRTTGDPEALISAFETIAALSGNIRDRKNWHHFGIGERIDFLRKCVRNPALIVRQDRKIIISMILYFLVVGGAIGATRLMPASAPDRSHGAEYLEAVLHDRIRTDPHNALWYRLLGDLMQDRKMEEKALAAYEQALERADDDADIMNNLAWMLLTAHKQELRDPRRALDLAEKAAAKKRRGYILDTLATALWANGMSNEAIDMEERAIELDPENGEMYRSQIEKFRSIQY